MSLAAAQLTPYPQDGAPLSVEVIDGTTARRITRRFMAPAELVREGQLAQAVEAYGTADGAYAGTDATRRTPEARALFPSALLVEVRIVPIGQETGGKRFVDKVYEETPYERTTSHTFDAQGAILTADKTVVLAYGQTLPAPTAGWSRVVLSSSRDAGRLVYSVRDARGEGDTGKTLNEDGDGVIVESGSYVTMTEPVDPEPGVYDLWRVTPASGYWSVSYSKPAAVQLPAPGRVRRSKVSRGDGSVVETVTQAGTDPACAASDWGTRTVVLTGESEYTRAGGIVGRTRTWLVIPADYTYNDNVRFLMPGLVELVGTDDVTVKVTPPTSLELRGMISESFGPDANSVSPWNLNAPCTYSVHGVLDVNGSKFVLSESRPCPGCVGTFAATGATKWGGVNAAPLAIAASSDPAARPSGETVAYSRRELYAVALDTDTKYWHATTARVSL